MIHRVNEKIYQQVDFEIFSGKTFWVRTEIHRNLSKFCVTRNNRTFFSSGALNRLFIRLRMTSERRRMVAPPGGGVRRPPPAGAENPTPASGSNLPADTHTVGGKTSEQYLQHSGAAPLCRTTRLGRLPTRLRLNGLC